MTLQRPAHLLSTQSRLRPAAARMMVLLVVLRESRIRMLGSSQCDSVSLFGAGRGGVLQAAGAGDLQPANHCSQRAQPPASRGTAREAAGRERWMPLTVVATVGAKCWPPTTTSGSPGAIQTGSDRGHRLVP
ncbi:hypothetical protein KC354_g57 [Hortaea werneckii]|nr:hypothetical protein KC354_g57 [Hortaea werneckii]